MKNIILITVLLPLTSVCCYSPSDHDATKPTDSKTSLSVSGADPLPFSVPTTANTAPSTTVPSKQISDTSIKKYPSDPESNITEHIKELKDFWMARDIDKIAVLFSEHFNSSYGDNKESMISGLRSGIVSATSMDISKNVISADGKRFQAGPNAITDGGDLYYSITWIFDKDNEDWKIVDFFYTTGDELPDVEEIIQGNQQFQQPY